MVSMIGSGSQSVMKRSVTDSWGSWRGGRWKGGTTLGLAGPVPVFRHYRRFLGTLPLHIWGFLSWWEQRRWKQGLILELKRGAARVLRAPTPLHPALAFSCARPAPTGHPALETRPRFAAWGQSGLWLLKKCHSGSHLLWCWQRGAGMREKENPFRS